MTDSIANSQSNSVVTRPLVGISFGLLSRLLNFLILPISLHIFTPQDFLKLSWFAILATGVSTVSGLGLQSQITNLILQQYRNEGNLFYRLLKSMTLFWIIELIFLTMFYQYLIPHFKYLPLWVFVLAAIDGILQSMQIDLFSCFLQVKNQTNKTYLLGILLAFLLGPLRILIIFATGPDTMLWFGVGVFFRLFVLIISGFIIHRLVTRSKNQSSTLGTKISILSKQSFFILFGVQFWLLITFDKYLVSKLFTAIDASGYQAAFQFASILSLIYVQINFAIHSKQIEYADSPALGRYLDREIWMMLTSSFFFTGLIYLGVFIFIPDGYESTIEILPVLILTHFFYFPIPIWISIHARINEKGHLAWLIPTFGVITAFVITIIVYTHIQCTLDVAIISAVSMLTSVCFGLWLDSKLAGGIICKAIFNLKNVVAILCFLITQIASLSWVSPLEALVFGALLCLVGLPLMIGAAIRLGRFSSTNTLTI